MGTLSRNALTPTFSTSLESTLAAEWLTCCVGERVITEIHGENPDDERDGTPESCGRVESSIVEKPACPVGARAVSVLTALGKAEAQHMPLHDLREAP